MTRNEVPVQADWRKRKFQSSIPPKAVEAIVRRRRQMLIHSCIYYHLDDSIISDHQWTHWAQQLFKLQRKFGWQVGFYDKLFKTWDGSTGHHLPHTNPDVLRVARRLLDEARERREILS